MSPEQFGFIEKELVSKNIEVFLYGRPESFSGDYERITTSIIKLYCGSITYWIDINDISAIKIMNYG